MARKQQAILPDTQRRKSMHDLRPTLSKMPGAGGVQMNGTVLLRPPTLRIPATQRCGSLAAPNSSVNL